MSPCYQDSSRGYLQWTLLATVQGFNILESVFGLKSVVFAVEVAKSPELLKSCQEYILAALYLALYSRCGHWNGLLRLDLNRARALALPFLSNVLTYKTQSFLA